ncbi:MAG: hypothetical protein M5U12_31765 [Verrucomicrobia bacterium]|nr:hypothetical protein [Verrucomicrobiota bacterium]
MELVRGAEQTACGSSCRRPRRPSPTRNPPAQAPSAPARRRRVAPGDDPLFPGYFFARFCPAHSVTAVRGAPGVLRVVGTSQTPLPLAHDIVESLRQRVQDDGFVRVEAKGLQRGERVQIEAGPFAGWMGRVERETDGHQRVLILLEALQQARVWLEASSVEPVASAR